MLNQPNGRDLAIDAIRGFCIVSMITGHIAGSSLLAGVIHIFPKFDGASGFVLLSGLVLGVVHSRRAGMPGALAIVQRATLKRVLQVYLAQVALSAIGVLAVLWGGWRHSTFPPDLPEMPFPRVLMGVLTMNIAPPGGDVLRLYVVFLVLAIGAYWLLARGLWVVLLGLSAVLAFVGYAFPHATSFSLFGGAASASWAGWQLLFFSALTLGWYWQRYQMAVWLRRHSMSVILASALVVVASAGLSIVMPNDAWLFSKFTFPPGRIVVAYAVIAALYVAAVWFMEGAGRHVLRPLYRTGQKSLDSYVIQSVATVLVIGLVGLNSTSYGAQIAAVAVFGVCWMWAEALRGRKTPMRSRIDQSSLEVPTG